jgi:hypothetical protein
MIGPALLHSVSYAGLWGQAFLPVEDFRDKAAALGYQGVMLSAHPSETAEASKRSIAMHGHFSSFSIEPGMRSRWNPARKSVPIR